MRIKELRLKANLTQRQLADKLGILRTAVAMWEIGRSVPATEKLPALAGALGCRIDDLFEEER